MQLQLGSAAPIRPYLPPAEDVLNHDVLSRPHVAGLQRSFAAAQPFPHVVIDNLFAPALLERIAQEFEQIRVGDWVRYDTPNEVKYGTRPTARLGPASQAYFDAIHRSAFIELLGAVTGIAGLIPDPSLKGGGLHEIQAGGRFGVHLDFDHHPVTRLHNRLVLITYLNKGWQPEWGGVLELWSASQNRCVASVVPEFGRSILFAHSAVSLHGHPQPLTPPDGRTRRSIAAYYYTNGRPDDDRLQRAGSHFHQPPSFGRWGRAATIAKLVTPPVLVDVARWLRRRPPLRVRRAV